MTQETIAKFLLDSALGRAQQVDIGLSYSQRHLPMCIECAVSATRNRRRVSRGGVGGIHDNQRRVPTTRVLRQRHLREVYLEPLDDSDCVLKLKARL